MRRPVTLLALLVTLLLVSCAAPQPEPIPPPPPPSPPPVTSPPGVPSPDPQPPTPEPQPPSPTPEDPRESLIRATVRVVAETHSGSGTIISPDGLIVTNAHVAAPDAPGVAVLYSEIGGSDPVRRIEILMTDQEDRAPIARYTAEVVAADGYLDIAVLQITGDIDGQPLAPGELDLPWIPIGDSDQLRLFDPLRVVGFPGLGGSTVSSRPGEVGGFLPDPRVGERAWIKFSEQNAGGNSGGLAANALGEIVGIPTRGARQVGAFGHLRPINLARPLIDAARAGRAYPPSPYVTLGSGDETLQFTGWRGASDTDCSGDTVSTYPSGTPMVLLSFSYSGFTDGQDLLWHWTGPRSQSDDTETLFSRSAEAARWEWGSSGQCLWFRTPSRQAALADGTYTFVLASGAMLELMAFQQVLIAGSPADEPGSVHVRGSIIDGSTGRGVADALVFFLEPGTDIQEWVQLASTDVDAFNRAIVASARTAANGSYELNAALMPNTTYPIVIAKDGYALRTATYTTGTESVTLDAIALAPTSR